MQVLWFRRDLRVKDSELLSLKDLDLVLPIFIFDTNILEKLQKNDKRVSFIFEKVLKLKKDLKKIGLNLAIFYGKPEEVFKYLKMKNNNLNLFASKDFESYSKKRDEKIAQIVDSFTLVSDNYLFDFENLRKKDGNPYKVFTPFYKHSQKIYSPELIKEKNINQNFELFEYINFDYILKIKNNDNIKLDLDISSIGFEKYNFDKISNFNTDPYKLLELFSQKIDRYKENRDFFNLNSTSNLSTHLRFGTISVREIVRKILELKAQKIETETEPFYRQLIWREFFASIFYFFPYSESNNFLDIKVPWENDESKFEAWKQGKTGVPIVDAGMRELNEFGTMHNRVRMIVASFLTKDLRIDWKLGETYFAGKLLDYDATSNVSSWQWSASTGTDAQPYFRVFNPYLQAKKFDPTAEYIYKFLPELKNIPATVLFDEEKLFKQKIIDYSVPIVQHKIEAQKTINMFKNIRKN